MPRSTSPSAWLAAALLSVAISAGAIAQTPAATAPGTNPAATPATAATTATTPATPTAPGAPGAASATGGIKGQNIFDVKPEVKPDASAAPGYMEQSNAERARVQPGNNAPMWRAVGSGAEGFTSLPRAQAPEAGVLVQPFVQYPGSRFTTAGEAWRQVRNQWLIPYGGALLLIALGAVALFYFTKGPIGQHAPDTGRKIERFTPFERSAHWANAIAFVALAISGIVMAFGKFFLLPIMGATLFGWLTYALKNIHNFVGPVFIVSLVIIFATFLRSNWPEKGDMQWIRRAGGLFGKAGHEPPSGRFNAGEKVVFWVGVFLLGIVVAGSGLVLDQLIPGLLYERRTMQIAHMIHAVSTVLMMAMFIGHIYLGTVGMKGAYSAMRSGYVDEAWAREHHAYWYEDIQSGKVPAQRSVPRDDTPPAEIRPA